MPHNAPSVVVSFEEFECVAHGGVTRTTYTVLIDGNWKPVHQFATAITRKVASKPGVIWTRIVELPLAVGTVIEKVIETPERDQRPDTGSILFGRSRGQRNIQRRVRMLVDTAGQLTRNETR